MTIRWGILGCGDVARRRVAAAIQQQSDSVLQAVCRRNEQKLQQFCDDFHVPDSYSDSQQLLTATNIDAVYIATPVYLHEPQTLLAAKARKHVLVEKPMAMSVAECESMIEVCQQNQVKLGVAYYRRFYPVVARMAEILSAGELGQPLSVTAVTATPFNFQPGEDGYWRVLREEGGGGALMDIGSHRIDLFQHLFGPIGEVAGFISTLAADYQADDCTTLTMRFTSGVHAVLQCYFGATIDPDEFTILGTSGRLSVTPLNQGRLIVESSAGRREESLPPSNNFNDPLIDDFVAAIQQDREPLISGPAGCVTNQVMEAAYLQKTVQIGE
ncbi:MAG TPA: Gfo/Idh/MocA family oxidoreductase [Planctomycetaceae bacterium]|nr:Gfo/Idh/MocA family oxidoreductase [Planctomycetaceae bacterium]